MIFSPDEECVSHSSVCYFFGVTVGDSLVCKQSAQKIKVMFSLLGTCLSCLYHSVPVCTCVCSSLKVGNVAQWTEKCTVTLVFLFPHCLLVTVLSHVYTARQDSLTSPDHAAMPCSGGSCTVAEFCAISTAMLPCCV